MLAPDHPHALLAAALDAGDYLIAACDAGDLEAAAAAVEARAKAVAALEEAPRPETLPQALVVRFRAQDARLNRALERRLGALSDAVAEAARATAAHAGYGAPAPGPRLDTAPR